ncbi:MAG TPA: PDZ domain-containing protein [Terracidiphilus sp.]|jgi:membrane-associated protease RseP (regulator of RpoE activity)|nr:PDZ domain-containing protein [Terracidiphilus sp.]
MKHLLRPYRKLHPHAQRIAIAAAGAWLAIVLVVAVLVCAARPGRAQTTAVIHFLHRPFPLLAHSSSQGYLGVSITDVDADKAQALKVKEAHGAVITLIDHDAPAGQVGLKINDVVLALNGQTVDGADQLRKMLREIPPGHKISLEISRDGNIQTMAVELAERKTLDHDVWDKIDSDGDGIAPVPGMAILPGGSGGGDEPYSSGFHLPFFGSSLNVGTLVEPLTSQMADYLGVAGGLMVKQVTRKSEAATAGFRAFDVILKVGMDAITTSADWERALRSNQGKPVQVTILRDKKQQTLTLQVDSKRHGALERGKLPHHGQSGQLATLTIQPNPLSSPRPSTA